MIWRTLLACSLLLVACGDRPTKVAGLLDGKTPLHLWVSNQSTDRDPVDIDIWIDERHVVTGDFDVGNQHNWYAFEFETGVGSHTLRAESQAAEIAIDLGFEVPGETWAQLDFWYYLTPQGGAQPTPPHFSWLATQRPLIFH